MPYISKKEHYRLLTEDIMVDALLGIEADRMGKKEYSKAAFKSMEEKLKVQFETDLQDPKMRELCKQYGINTDIEI